MIPNSLLIYKAILITIAVCVYAYLAYRQSMTEKKPLRRYAEERYLSLFAPDYLLSVFAVACAVILVWPSLNYYTSPPLFSTHFVLYFFAIFLTTGIYYALLTLSTRFLRGCITANACATLWFLPNVLFFSYFMMQPFPWRVLLLDEAFCRAAGTILLLGAFLIIGKEVITHIVIRRRLLSDAYPVPDNVRAVYDEEAHPCVIISRTERSTGNISYRL